MEAGWSVPVALHGLYSDLGGKGDGEREDNLRMYHNLFQFVYLYLYLFIFIYRL